MPSVPAAAISPMAYRFGYPPSIRAGSMIAPMAAAVAGLEPDMAAKIEQAAMVTTARPPGRWPNQALRQAMRYLDIPP